MNTLSGYLMYSSVFRVFLAFLAGNRVEWSSEGKIWKKHVFPSVVDWVLRGY